MNGVVDPESLEFSKTLELMDFIRHHASSDELSILKSLCGFEEELTVEELADTLNMQRPALYQKLHRLRARLRKNFRHDTVT